MGELVVAVAEVARLDPAFFDEGVDAVVDLAQAHAHFAGEFALGELGARFEQAQEAVVGFFHSIRWRLVGAMNPRPTAAHYPAAPYR